VASVGEAARQETEKEDWRGTAADIMATGSVFIGGVPIRR
jgi:hypothetical protein